MSNIRQAGISLGSSSAYSHKFPFKLDSPPGDSILVLGDVPEGDTLLYFFVCSEKEECPRRERPPRIQSPI
jgi:hypothetical protein